MSHIIREYADEKMKVALHLVHSNSFLTPQKEISCHIFKIAIFSKSFDDLMSHIIREYADEETK